MVLPLSLPRILLQQRRRNSYRTRFSEALYLSDPSRTYATLWHRSTCFEFLEGRGKTTLGAPAPLLFGEN